MKKLHSGLQILFSQREVDFKLMERHKKTRHDAIDIVNKHFADLIGNLDFSDPQEILRKQKEIERDIQNLKQ